LDTHELHDRAFAGTVRRALPSAVWPMDPARERGLCRSPGTGLQQRLLGTHWGGDEKYETRGGKVTLFCASDGTMIIAKWTTRQIADSVINPLVEQGAML